MAASSAFDTIVPVLIGIGCVLVILQPFISARLAARRARLGLDGGSVHGPIALWLAVALVGVYGVYDLTAMWQAYQLGSPGENNIEKFLGVSPADNRQVYFDASPISYAVRAKNSIGVFLAAGAEDDLVDRRAHTDAFLLALKQAGFFARTCIIPGAGHYWMNDPIDEPTSYPGFMAPRLLRFLAEKL